MVPITISINKCFTEGYFLKEMKKAKITPISKKGDEEKSNNYRSIAILPILSEIIKLTIKKDLLSFQKKRELFSAYQQGYRKDRNTKTDLQHNCWRFNMSTVSWHSINGEKVLEPVQSGNR